MVTPIKAVVFDMDGVLTDSEPLINQAAIAMFAERGLAVQPEDFFPFIGTGENRYLGGVAEKYGFVIELASAKKRTYEIYLELVPAKLHAFPGATDPLHDANGRASWIPHNGDFAIQHFGFGGDQHLPAELRCLRD